MDLPAPGASRHAWRREAIAIVALLLGTGLLAMVRAGVDHGGASHGYGRPVYAQACPPYCPTPMITPAWHMHMCDESYQEQLDDNHCMRGPGVTEFAAGTERVHIIYCHQQTDTVVIQIKDSGGGLQWVNHPDGVTYGGSGCESLIFAPRKGIPAGGSPFRTIAYWPEGPFTGAGANIEWFTGAFVAWDQDVYYGLAAEAWITGRDPGGNEDPLTQEVIQVRVSSTSDPTGFLWPLKEERTGFSTFRAERALRFTDRASNAAQGLLKVASRDEIRVEYCPRNCQTPYFDTAVWYQLSATITPTPLPTWPGPAPTMTSTPRPGVQVRYVTLRPAPADVGYVPQISSNKERPNHLGYPTLYSGMWTHGTNRHYGLVQFDLSSLPAGAVVAEARLELVGRENRFTEPGSWAVKFLETGIDAGWRAATYDHFDTAAAVAQVGETVVDGELAVGHRNSFGFAAVALEQLNARLTGSKRASFRVDGPVGEDNNLFAWESGVDTYNRATEPPDPALGPVLVLAYSVPPEASATPLASATQPTAAPGSSTATRTPSGSPSATPTSGGASPTASPSPSAGPSPTTSPTTAPTAQASPGTNPPPTAPPTTAAASPTATGPATQRQVCVLAYRDLNANGQQDEGERFLAGVTLRLTHVRSNVFDSWTTDGANDPDHCWSALIEGEYSLRAVSFPSGLGPSGLAEHRFTVPFPGLPARYAFGAKPPSTITPTASPSPSLAATVRPSVTPTPEDTAQPTVSGPSGEVCVRIFEDRDGDGQPAGEPWIGGQRIQILDEGRALSRALRSLAGGDACARLPVGVYFVRADRPAGAEATTAEEAPVLLTEGSRKAIVFGWRYDRRPGERIWLPVTAKMSRWAAPAARLHGAPGAGRLGWAPRRDYD